MLVICVVLVVSSITICMCMRNNNTSKTVSTDIKPIYQGNTGKKEIALTCNVFWGEDILPAMLKILDDNNVKMTFFIGGTWAEKNEELTEEIYEKGHEIGNHGYSHPHPDRLSKEDNLQDIQKCEKVLNNIIEKKTNLYAPPYGERGPAVLQAADQADYLTVLWSIDTVDWKNPTPDTILNKINEKAHNGAIILMHPTFPILHTLPEIIQSLREQGYSLVTVSQLLNDNKDSYIKSSR
ncbi:MAG: polysaccharide deacetylase family protein [Clostridiales bacterium]|nr:polysaccharide deacetylase family protein [Clostridiales bacterium]MCF8022189.1 polysaccharide deacetylase family protein [Clostridiales bacterium]